MPTLKNPPKLEDFSQFDIKNLMAVPKIVKVVVNMGIGELARNKESLEKTISELSLITGRKPSVRLAKVSVAGFNLRKGMPVGLKVTLRGKAAYNFLDKMISIVFPRIRDFRGLSLESFDHKGNYTIGISDHTVFPEVDITKIDKPKGLEITVVTNSKNFNIAKELLTKIGLPFEKES